MSKAVGYMFLDWNKGMKIMMSEETYIVRYLIKKNRFIKMFRRSFPIAHLKKTRSLNKEDIDLLIKHFGNITIGELLDLYEIAKDKILNSVRNRAEMLRIWNELETGNSLNLTQYERNLSHKIYLLMCAELFSGTLKRIKIPVKGVENIVSE